jgi:hypothetical protein
MSHFVEMQVPFDVKNEAHLIAALEKQFGVGNVQANPGGIALHGYEGNDRSKLDHSNPNWAPRCEIVIRRQHVGNASNDVGYHRLENGKYAAYVSDFDRAHHYGADKQGLVAQEYTLRVAEARLKAQGYTLQRETDTAGHVHLKASRY